MDDALFTGGGVARLRAQIDGASPIVGAGAGTGISAKFAEAGGADLIIIYNSGRYRMAGHGSLAGAARLRRRQRRSSRRWASGRCCRSSARRRSSPGSWAPTRCGRCRFLLRQLDELGFSGINNFPTVGLIDGRFRMELERTEHGLRQGGRHDPPGPRARLLHHRLRLQPRRGAGDGRGRGRLRSSPTWG